MTGLDVVSTLAAILSRTDGGSTPPESTLSECESSRQHKGFCIWGY